MKRGIILLVACSLMATGATTLAGPIAPLGPDDAGSGADAAS